MLAGSIKLNPCERGLMPLRKEVKELQKVCDEMVALMKQQPSLLTETERLDIETSITRIMLALVQAEEALRQQKPKAG
jgi:hypothetical protein